MPVRLSQHSNGRQSARSGGFTLAEILVSVGVLIAILLASARVFQTAQQVSNVGNAAADVLQETASIEKQIREDISRLSPQGAIAIHSVKVRNDQRIADWESDGSVGLRPGLINPNLNATAFIRCDQLVFFTDGISRVKQLGSDGYVTPRPGWFPKILGEGSMVYYGHAIQFPELKACNVNNPANTAEPPILHGHDVDFATLRDEGVEITPWFDGGINASVPTIYRQYPRAATDDNYEHFTIQFPQVEADPILGTQPEARRWILARQETVLGDDDQNLPGTSNKRIYMSRAFGTTSVFPVDPRWDQGFSNIHFSTIPLLECGRVDLAGMRMSGVTEALTISRDPQDPNNVLPANRSWDSGDFYEYDDGTLNRDILDQDGVGGRPDLPGDGSQRDLVKSLVRWPRAERVPPGEGRFDQHLTIPTLGSACSSFIVEWTWDEGIGDAESIYVDPQTDRTRVIEWEGLRVDPANGWDDPNGDPYLGQRWFGLYDRGRQVMPFGRVDQSVQDDLGWIGFADVYPGDVNPDAPAAGTKAPATVRDDAIEDIYYPPTFGGGGEDVPIEYWAVFGRNRDKPLLDVDWLNLNGMLSSDGDGDGRPDGDGFDDPDYSYTPWPTALRFTMVLHDPETHLENGQTIQFVVKLPERCQ
ncbi:MAG: hypothetical protein MK116_08280 [Phycisphaerales bacterium]|nr:hypothetical protein [Phycisphaerales bacterium]